MERCFGSAANVLTATLGRTVRKILMLVPLSIPSRWSGAFEDETLGPNCFLAFARGLANPGIKQDDELEVMVPRNHSFTGVAERRCAMQRRLKPLRKASISTHMTWIMLWEDFFPQPVATTKVM
jgi:hypothetical protein